MSRTIFLLSLLTSAAAFSPSSFTQRSATLLRSATEESTQAPAPYPKAAKDPLLIRAARGEQVER